MLTHTSAAALLTVLEPFRIEPAAVAMSCLSLVGLTGAIIDLFSALPAMLSRLASPPWRLLARSLLYESPESGSPVLAIFVAGSLCAILSFAFPIYVLVRVSAAGVLISGTISALEVLSAVHKLAHPSPQVLNGNIFIIMADEHGTSYSCLNQPKPSQDRRGPLWFLRPSVSCPAFGTNMNRTHENKREREREWLLLGEPSSPLSPTCPESPNRDARSPFSSPELLESALVSGADRHSDSTDIDAAVDEYKQDVSILQPIVETKAPTTATWRRSVVLITCVSCVSAIFATAVILEMTEAAISFSIVLIFITGLFWWIPRRPSEGFATCAAITVIIISILLIAEIMPDTWPAITIWITAGTYYLHK
ncbi:uncharacterized protein LOC113366999 [Ctenocephalides felis]|uniref:uncharacterized protein LOC113366999 n=1 Tax=Ctenocephalides felis TaxID=7515 RepID=UPI000E6E5737|nr:uncharacterized protein LOC113366999 [Ctenocephalides felis]